MVGATAVATAATIYCGWFLATAQEESDTIEVLKLGEIKSIDLKDETSFVYDISVPANEKSLELTSDIYSYQMISYQNVDFSYSFCGRTVDVISPNGGNVIEIAGSCDSSPTKEKRARTANIQIMHKPAPQSSLSESEESQRNELLNEGIEPDVAPQQLQASSPFEGEVDPTISAQSVLLGVAILSVLLDEDNAENEDGDTQIGGDVEIAANSDAATSLAIGAAEGAVSAQATQNVIGSEKSSTKLRSRVAENECAGVYVFVDSTELPHNLGLSDWRTSDSKIGSDSISPMSDTSTEVTAKTSAILSATASNTIGGEIGASNSEPASDEANKLKFLQLVTTHLDASPCVRANRVPVVSPVSSMKLGSVVRKGPSPIEGEYVLKTVLTAGPGTVAPTTLTYSLIDKSSGKVLKVDSVAFKSGTSFSANGITPMSMNAIARQDAAAIKSKLLTARTNALKMD